MAAKPPVRTPAAPLGLSIENVLDVSPDAVIAVDVDGRIVYANPAVKALFGWSPRELKGRRVETLVPVHVGDQHAARRSVFWGEPAARAMGTGLELSARRRDGLEFPVEISLVPVRSELGQVVFATVVDITSRVTLRRTLLG